MSGEGKWKTVGRKDSKKGRSFQGDEATNTSVYRSLGGLTESSTVFAKYAEAEEARTNPPPDASAPPQPNSTVEGGKKKGKKTKADRNKHQPTKSFQQRAKELEYEALKLFLNETKDQLMGNTQGFLKEVARFLQDWFSGVEVEKDYTFSDKEPGYPSSELDTSCCDLLLSHLSLCPQLALEGIFRHCIDTMLAEVKGHVSSHGTRVFLQLLTRTSPHLTAQSSERIKILLESNLNRVPESLSLLWVGLPHPKPHPLISLEAWSKVCLPVFTLSNVPRQVVTFAIHYSWLLLSNIGDGEVDRLRQLLPPFSLCDLLTSTSLLQRRTQKNVAVQDLCQVLQVKLLASGPAPQYFSDALLRIGQTSSPELLLDFAVGCLSADGRCFSVWQQLHSSNPHPSTLLLSHIHLHWGKLNQQLPEQSLKNYLKELCQTGRMEERDLAKECNEISQIRPLQTVLAMCSSLIDHGGSLANMKVEAEESDAERRWMETLLRTLRVAPGERVTARRSGYLRCLCYAILSILTGTYLCALGYFLVIVATEGPQTHMDFIRNSVSRELSVSQLVEWLWTILSQLIVYLSWVTQVLTRPS